MLLQFALDLADLQTRNGRHYMLENPQPSQAWTQNEMTKFLDEHASHMACFHQCRFGLRGKFGLHRKATKLASSSWIAARLVDGQFCNRLCAHQPVIGGKKITEAAGHYPMKLAKTLVDGMERQFHSELGKMTSKANDAMTAQEYHIGTDEEEEPNLGRPAGEDESESSEAGDKPKLKISAGLKAAITAAWQHRASFKSSTCPCSCYFWSTC